MALPFKALVVPGGLALAGYLWWCTSGSSKPETEDGAVSTAELPELAEEDEQCARSIQTRAPVSDSFDEVQDIVESCEEIEELQDPVTCQAEPEIVVIGQPDLSSEGVEDLQGTLTWGEMMDITHPIDSSEKLEDILPLLTWSGIEDISQPIESSEKIDELQDPVTCQAEPEIVDIGQPDLSSEGVEEPQELQDPVICQAEPEIVDIGQPDETCEEKEITSSMGQWAKQWDLPTLTSEKPFVHKCPQRPQMSKRPKESTSQFVWEARVPNSLIGRFIGKAGWRVKSLMEETGTKMEIKTLSSSDKFQLILVTGTLKQIDKAAVMIRNWFKTFKVDLPLYTLRRVSLR